MQKLAHEIYSFDEFRLDLTRGTLLRGTEEIKLRPKSFEVLRYLTQNSGRLVTKDELIGFVWQGTAVTDDSLVQCLKDIRTALADKEQSYIKTVPRRGYIFEKEVTENGGVYLEETTGIHLVIEETQDSESALEVSERRTFVDPIRRHPVISTVALAALVTVASGALFFSNSILAWWFKPPSIAVLPIVNSTGNADLEYLSDGLTESIIQSLNSLNQDGKFSRLRVITPSTVFVFKDKNMEPREAGRRLAVDTVLASKMSEENGLRTFKFELINVDDGSVRWSKPYSTQISRPVELLESQNEIPADVAAHLPLRLSDTDRQNLTRRYTQNPDAYDAYLKGRLNSAKLTPSGLKQSIEDFQQALDLDPNFALAYWGMGMSYRLQGALDERPDKEANEKAFDLIQKALKIDNTLTVAKDAMKGNEADKWDWEAIKKVGTSHPAYGDYLAAAGRFDELIKDQKERLAKNPYVPRLNMNHCMTLAFTRHYPEAVLQCQKTLNLVPVADQGHFDSQSPWVHLILANIYTDQQKFDDAIAEGKMAVDLAEGSEAMMAVLGYVYAKAGQRDEALKIADYLNKQMEKGEYVPPLNLGWLYGALGDNDKAFFWFDRAYDEQEAKLMGIRSWPTWDSIRSDSRFPDFQRRLNLPD
jgi:DNA-binding winged helix-turn-helix (wHTH) protein/TolB-like protein